MNLWRGPLEGRGGRLRGPVAGVGALVASLLVQSAALAQGAGAAAPRGLAAHFGSLLISFGVLLAAFLGLLFWEFLDRRAGQETGGATGGGSPYMPPTGVAEPALEEDPFQALLRKSAPHREEPMATPFRTDSLSDVPAGTSPYAGQEPAPPPRPAREASEEDEELSPFQRLAQIGTEERDTFAPAPPSAPPPPAAPARPARIELSPMSSPEGSKPEGGGEWAALLSKVQAEEPTAAPPPPAAPPPLKVSEEEDPWKKLLGQTSGEASAGPPARLPGGGDEDADPWQALLRKTSGELPAVSGAPPHVAGGADEQPPPGSEPPAEPGRPRAISLDLKRDGGRPIPPPPQTEDEEAR